MNVVENEESVLHAGKKKNISICLASSSSTGIISVVNF